MHLLGRQRAEGARRRAAARAPARSAAHAPDASSKGATTTMASMLRAKQKRQAQLQKEQDDVVKAAVVDLKGHCHLPNIQSNHVVPSNRLLGRVYRRKLHEVVCRKDMFRIWNALGTSIASTMLQGKGVRFDGVLDLTFDIEGQPMYKLERDQNVILKTFGSGHHALWRAAHDFLPGDGAPVLATLPLESVAQSLNRRREERRKKREQAGVTTDTLQLSRHGMGGFERGRNLDKLGMKSQDTAELFFNDLYVPEENVLGGEGAGFLNLVNNLPQERLSIAITGTASAQAAFNWTVEYVTEREAFGQKVSSFQNTRFELAEMKTELDLAWVFIDRQIQALNEGDLTAEDAAEAKWWCTEMQLRTITRCLQLFGGDGFMSTRASLVWNTSPEPDLGAFHAR